MITVLKALTTKGFAGSAIVAGWEGLGRSVTSITVAEVPDAIDWLRGGEIVLSTAFYMKERPEWFEKWVEGMVQVGAAALAIKPQRFIGTIPENIIEKANRLRFPLVALPFNVTWPMIINPLAEELLRSEQASPSVTSDSWQKGLLQIIIDGLGFPTLGEFLCRRLGMPVIIQNQHMDVYAAKAPEGLEWKWSGILSARLTNEAVLNLRNQLRAPEKLLTWRCGDTEVFEYFFKLVAHGKLLGYLSVLRLADDPRFEEALAEYAANVVSLAFARLATAVEEAQSRKRHLLRNFLRSNSLDGDKDLELALRQKGAFLLIRPDIGTKGTQSTEQVDWGHVLARIEAMLQSGNPLSILTDLPEGLAVLVHITRNQDPVRYLKAVAGEISSRLAGALPGSQPAVGIGRVAAKPEEYHASFVQAKRALGVAVSGAAPDRICLFDEIGIYRLLDRIQDSAVLKEYKDEVLSRLEQADSDSGQGLLLTLEAYFDADCSTRRAAQALYLHENTVRYRLQQVQKLTGLNLLRFDDRVRLYLALKISHLGI